MITQPMHTHTDGTEMLERACAQWQAGDWESLVLLDRDTLQPHPDRATLALLAATGHQQIGDMVKTKEYTSLAQQWGASKNAINQYLISGVKNTLGLAYTASGQLERAHGLFQESLRLVEPSGDLHLLGKIRATRAATQLGLLGQAAKMLDGQIEQVKSGASQMQALVTVLQIQMEILHHELSLSIQRQQLTSEGVISDSNRHSKLDQQHWEDRLAKLSPSQLGQDLWVLERTHYKQGGFFVEFGATDGVLLSNTWLLETHMGWQGICAEPNPKYLESLRRNRSCDVTNACIGARSGETVEFVLADEYGGMAQDMLRDMHSARREAYYADARNRINLLTESLDDMLCRMGAPREIDYLSIDTEGSEFSILAAFPFDQWTIHLITVEHNYSPDRERLHALLTERGYTCTEAQWDDWYELRQGGAS